MYPLTHEDINRDVMVSFSDKPNLDFSAIELIQEQYQPKLGEMFKDFETDSHWTLINEKDFIWKCVDGSEYGDGETAYLDFSWLRIVNCYGPMEFLGTDRTLLHNPNQLKLF